MQYKNLNYFRKTKESTVSPRSASKIKLNFPDNWQHGDCKEVLIGMKNDLESTTSSTDQALAPHATNWARVGIIAAASALAGGLAAAWWYRKTITKLHQTEEIGQNPHFGIPEDDSSDES
jgi:hypothetical protein